MNCEVVQKRLLSCESPDSPSVDAATHLADCTACREWLLRLVQMERAVPYLPVPPADTARSALMRRILSQGTENGKPETVKTAQARGQRRPSIAMVVGSWIMDPHASPRRRVAAGLVAGVAAALLLFVIGWMVRDGGQPSTNVPNPGPKASPDQLLADLGRRGIHTADNMKGGDRVKAMAEVADQIHARCRDAVGAGAHEELIALAELYGRVVDEGVVRTAEGLTDDEQHNLLGPIALRLKDADSAWQRLSQQTGLPDRVKDALARAALAASNGKKRLDELSA